MGVSLEGIYVGTLAHMDDLRSLTCNPHSIIHEFLTENFLQLNADKCELIVHSSGNHFDSTSVKLGSQTLKPTTASKCLCTWWTHNLTSTKFSAENICKARKAFFSFGSIGVFHRNLNPLSSNSVIETCVMSVLLFGYESWYLTYTTLDDLERFQCNIGRRILQLSCFHSNISIRIGLDWPSVRARVFIQKLNYLRQLR